MGLSKSEQLKNNFPGIISYRTASMEIIIPVFAGVLCSLLLCAVAGVLFGFIEKPEVVEPAAEIIHEEKEDDFLLTAIVETNDAVLEYFRNPEYQEWVVEFFTGICLNREIAQAVLENADKFDISPALAFALSWEESRFNPMAVNKHNRDGSIDRGLFQLNNNSFPNLEITVFFDVNVNSYYGMGHLRYCLDMGSSEISALAMYNAGTGRVKSSGAPEVTLNYISRILENRRKIENQFLVKLSKEEENRLAEVVFTEKQNDDFPFHINRTLITASPL